MEETYENIGKNTLQIFRKGITPFIIKTYNATYKDKFVQEINSISRGYYEMDFSSKQAIENSIDTQLCLDLILKNKSLFNHVFKMVGFKYLEEIRHYRNNISHDKNISLDSLLYLVEITKRILKSIDAIEEEKDCGKILSQLIKHHYLTVEKEVDSQDVNYTLQGNVKEFNLIIERLTDEQYEALKWIRTERRAAISGCAGSGKTILAVQKAISYDEAGLKTLILCHNPYLSDYLKKLTHNTGVDVFDFTNWVNNLCNLPQASINKWVADLEPMNDELNNAINKLLHPSNSLKEQLILGNNKYDAIIVDEGQDFEESWWLLVLAALKDFDNSFLYIFHDDNQILVPRKIEYPIKKYPILLSKNCRNGGEIFEKVKQFHSNPPNSSMALIKKGICKECTYSDNNLERLLGSAIKDALNFLPINEIVMLTTKGQNTLSHSLNNKNIYIPPDYYNNWKDIIFENYEMVTSSLNIKKETIHLSNSYFPTSNDIVVVVEIFNKIKSILEKEIKVIHQTHMMSKVGKKFINFYGSLYNYDFWNKNVISPQIKWRIENNFLNITKRNHALYQIELVYFFSNKNWAKNIPIPKTIRVVNTNEMKPNKNEIYFTTVSMFKGLESNAIILLDENLTTNRRIENLYVGSSRAKYYLNILTRSR